MTYLLLAVGFVVLTFAADLLVVGASALAKRLHVSDLLIGLTVVAFGTSAPELMVNMVAAINGTSEIAITNILGSNAINTFVILGLSALVFPLVAQRSCIRFDMPMSAFAGLVVLLVGTEFFGIFPSGFQGISRWDGVFLLLVFSLFMWHSIKTGIREGNNSQDNGSITPMKMFPAILRVVLGLGGLVLGGELIVRSAVSIATSWGVPSSVVGVTIVALGTSLPELATSVAAAAKKNVDLAIGNVIGSNIFNVFFVLGTSAVIRPLAQYQNLGIDATMATISSLMVCFFVMYSKKHRISRFNGALLLLVYAGYLTWLIQSLS